MTSLKCVCVGSCTLSSFDLTAPLLRSVGDACDDDQDGDGISNIDDNCRLVSNPAQEHVNLAYDAKGSSCLFYFSIFVFSIFAFQRILQDCNILSSTLEVFPFL